MLGIGEYSERRSMVMRSSGHISLDPTLEGPEYVLHHRLRLHWQLARLAHLCTPYTNHPCSTCSETLPGRSFHNKQKQCSFFGKELVFTVPALSIAP
jgi:hypothetical protein